MGSAYGALELSAVDIDPDLDPDPDVDVPVARAAGPTAGRRRATLAELRARLSGDQIGATFPVLPALAELFPSGGLRKGAAYTVEGATSLVLAMLAGPSRAGSWCGVVGLPGLGLEAAAGYGIELGRLVLVPAPERRWLETVAALLDVLDIVVVRPPGMVTGSDTNRLAARLRERGGALIAVGEPSVRPGEPEAVQWPGSELRFTVSESSWKGLGDGHGYLAARQVTVSASGRGSAGRSRTARLWLPDRNGEVAAVQPEALPATPSATLRAEPGSRASGEVIELASARAGVPVRRAAG